MSEEIETPVAEPQASAEPVKETETPESDPILESLNDDQSEIIPDKPEESEEEKKEKTDVPAEKETTDEEKEESETEAKPEAEQEDKKEEELDPEEAKKEEARRRYEERERVRAERKARVAEQTQPYIDEAENDTDRRLRDMEVATYNQTIEGTENALVSEFERAKASPELQMFNPESESFNKDLYEYAMENYNAGQIEYDTNGNMVGLKGSLYQHLTKTAELYRGAIKSGQFQQVRADRKMKTKADTKPAAQPKEEVKDPILEGLMSDD